MNASQRRSYVREQARLTGMFPHQIKMIQMIRRMKGILALPPIMLHTPRRPQPAADMMIMVKPERINGPHRLVVLKTRS